MRRFIALWFVLCLLAVPAFANQKLQGWTENGGTSVTIPGTQGSGTQRFQQSFRGATVTVYLAGTVTLATIYSDNLATPTAKGNPFPADGTTGQWFFYATSGRYDVKFSGGGITTPFTLGDFILYDYADATNSGRSPCLNTGANFGAKFTAAAALLPSTGGDIDCSNLQGAQIVATDVFTGVTKNVNLWLGGAAIEFQANTTIPTNVCIQAEVGTTFVVDSGITLTINCPITGYQPVNTGAGTLIYSGRRGDFAKSYQALTPAATLSAGGALTGGVPIYLALIGVNAAGGESPIDNDTWATANTTVTPNGGNLSVKVTTTNAAESADYTKYRAYYGTAAGIFTRYAESATLPVTITTNPTGKPVLSTATTSTNAGSLLTPGCYTATVTVRFSDGYSIPSAETGNIACISLANNRNNEIDYTWPAVAGATGYLLCPQGWNDGSPRDHHLCIQTGNVTTYAYTNPAARYFVPAFGNDDAPSAGYIYTPGLYVYGNHRSYIGGELFIAGAANNASTLIMDHSYDLVNPPTAGVSYSAVDYRYNTSQYWLNGIFDNTPNTMDFGGFLNGAGARQSILKLLLGSANQVAVVANGSTCANPTIINSTGTAGFQWFAGPSLLSICVGGAEIGRFGVGQAGIENSGNSWTSPAYLTNTNCGRNDGVCVAAAAGATVIAAGTTTIIVATTVVTANSEILIQFDETLSTRLSVTCNSASASEAAQYFVSSRSAGVSFTVKTNVAPTTNPACFNYWIVN